MLVLPVLFREGAGRETSIRPAPAPPTPPPFAMPAWPAPLPPPPPLTPVGVKAPLFLCCAASRSIRLASFASRRSRLRICSLSYFSSLARSRSSNLRRASRMCSARLTVSTSERLRRRGKPATSRELRRGDIGATDEGEIGDAIWETGVAVLVLWLLLLRWFPAAAPLRLLVGESSLLKVCLRCRSE